MKFLRGSIRGTFPGFTYQLGNLLAAGTLTIEALLASRVFPLPGGRPGYATAMAVFTAGSLIFVLAMTVLGYVAASEHRERALPAPIVPAEL